MKYRSQSRTCSAPGTSRAPGWGNRQKRTLGNVRKWPISTFSPSGIALTWLFTAH